MLEELFKYGDTVTLIDNWYWKPNPLPTNRWTIEVGFSDCGEITSVTARINGNDLVKLISDMLLLLQPIELVVVEDEKV